MLLENNFPLDPKFMFEANFLEWNFSFSHEKKLTFFSVITQKEEAKKKPKKTNPKQSKNETKDKSSTKPGSGHTLKSLIGINAKE